MAEASHHIGDIQVKHIPLKFTRTVVDPTSPFRWNALAMPQRNRIRELREARGLSQDALAKLAHTSSQQISRLEKSERKLSPDWLSRLSKALGCDPWDLLPTMAPSADAIELLNDYRELNPEQRHLVRSLVAQMRARDSGGRE